MFSYYWQAYIVNFVTALAELYLIVYFKKYKYISKDRNIFYNNESNKNKYKNGPSSEMPNQSQNNLVSLSKNLIQAKYHFIVAYKQILHLL